MALTATATPRVSQDIMKQLQMKSPVMFSASFNRPNLQYHVLQKKKSVIEDMAERIIEKHSDRFNHVEAGIVYCLSRNDCEKVADELQVRPPVVCKLPVDQVVADYSSCEQGQGSSSC